MQAELVVLAAGASTRMGHPKALTRIAGETALERIVRAAGDMRVIVVLGDDEARVRAALPADLRATLLRNPHPARGRTGSLQVGLSAIRGERALVLPVDHPLVAPATFARIAARPEEWVVPTYNGRGGHPVKLGPLAIAAVRTAPPETPLRDIPAGMGLVPTRIPVDDPGVLANLDTPADVAGLG